MDDVLLNTFHKDPIQNMLQKLRTLFSKHMWNLRASMLISEVYYVWTWSGRWVDLLLSFIHMVSTAWLAWLLFVCPNWLVYSCMLKEESYEMLWFINKCQYHKRKDSIFCHHFGFCILFMCDKYYSSYISSEQKYWVIYCIKEQVIHYYRWKLRKIWLLFSNKLLCYVQILRFVRK
jgi:hypothetical protein